MANAYTPGLKLRQPGQGDDFWDDDLNANAAVIEAALGPGSGLSGVIGDGLVVSAGAGLSAAYTAGSCRVNGTKFTVSSGAVAVAGGLNFVYVNAAGAVVASSSLPQPPYAALAVVEAEGGAVVRVGDLRRRISDVLKEHNEDGKHTTIKPASVEPTGTAGAYKRSAAAGYLAPEAQVNNLILRGDPDVLIYITGASESFLQEYTASSLGSGLIPADANGLVVGARCFDTTAGQRSGWRFYPSDAASDDDIMESAVARCYGEANVASQVFFSQLMFRLGPQGRFKLQCTQAPQYTAYLKVRLVGWTEPA